MPWIPAAIVAGGMLGSAYMSSNAQSKAAANASNTAYGSTLAQIAAQKESEQKAYEYQRPFYESGVNALDLLQQPETTWTVDTYLDGQKGTYSYQDIVNANKAAGATTLPADELLRKFQNAGGYNVKTGIENPSYVDPTGGAGQYLQSLSNLQAPNLPELGNLPDLNIPEFSYTFDPNDPAYQFKLSESQKAIDAAAAARGNYNSRAAINQISDAQRAITADEVLAQFNRAKDIYGLNAQTALSNYGADYSRIMDLYNTDYSRAMDLYNIGYGKNTDLFNMATGLGGTEYQKLIDLVKIGQGSASSAGNTSLATGQGIASSYGQLSQAQQAAQYAKGQAKSDFWSGLAPAAMNAYQMYLLNSGGSYNPSSYSNIYGLNYPG